MELLQRKCKECGELFTPRSAKQQYCDKLHYRPCPVCGKMVEAKYLSDPARCCSRECSKQLSAKTRELPKVKPKVEVKPEPITPTPLADDNTFSPDAELDDTLIEVSTLNNDETFFDAKSVLDDDLLQVRYLGPTSSGFVHNHKYMIKITKPNGVGEMYNVTATYDLTDKDDTLRVLHLSSHLSLKRYFAKAI